VLRKVLPKSEINPNMLHKITNFAEVICGYIRRYSQRIMPPQTTKTPQISESVKGNGVFTRNPP
jgi:hypothetical protein